MDDKLPHCVGCSREIKDRYILRVAPDLTWHAACLRCEECQQYLDENCTCFVRDGKPYCKNDYVEIFGAKCDKCGCKVSKSDLVMRAKSKIFHVDCFRCTPCERQLNPGEEFALMDGSSIYCKDDHDRIEVTNKGEKSDVELNNNQNTEISVGQNFHNVIKHLSSEFGSNSGKKLRNSLLCQTLIIFQTDSDSESDSYKSRSEKPQFRVIGKPTRVRTVLNEKQLSVLTSCYKINSRPDALLREQLVEMTGLSPRVIRVWFQNKRCKDKKKSQELKMQIQQETVNYLQGTLLNETSPVKYESPINDQSHDATDYLASWKSLSEFGLQNQYEKNHFNQVCAIRT